MEMADMHTWYKMGVKHVAEKHGYSVTFMAQPEEGKHGSSCHLHVSLMDRNESNAFQGSEVQLVEGRVSCSPYLVHFLGGWMKYV